MPSKTRSVAWLAGREPAPVETQFHAFGFLHDLPLLLEGNNFTLLTDPVNTPYAPERGHRAVCFRDNPQLVACVCEVTAQEPERATILAGGEIHQPN